MAHKAKGARSVTDRLQRQVPLLPLRALGPTLRALGGTGQRATGENQPCRRPQQLGDTNALVSKQNGGWDRFHGTLTWGPTFGTKRDVDLHTNYFPSI